MQRWLGLATVSIQTASGAEMVIEGVLEAEALRDFLYQRMRGAEGLDHELPAAATDPTHADTVTSDLSVANDEATRLLKDIRDALVALAARDKEQP